MLAFWEPRRPLRESSDLAPVIEDWDPRVVKALMQAPESAGSDNLEILSLPFLPWGVVEFARGALAAREFTGRSIDPFLPLLWSADEKSSSPIPFPVTRLDEKTRSSACLICSVLAVSSIASRRTRCRNDMTVTRF